MGDVKKYLSKGKLPEREKHNSRLFIDLAENIHIHHREYRTVFSLDEFLEYTDVVLKGREEIISYLENNPDYEEMKFPTTILVSGGRSQQLKYLKNSPHPNCSSYFNNTIAIELQEEYVADEVHIHYRDFRIVCNRSTFREIAEHFETAKNELNNFEKKRNYVKEFHPDSDVTNFNETTKSVLNTVQGTREINISQIQSYWYKDIISEMKADRSYIEALMQSYDQGEYITPIVISTELNGSHLVIDGHHRLFAMIKAGIDVAPCIVMELPFKATKKIRDAEVALKEFDKETDYKYSFSGYFKSYISMKTNRFYFKNFESLKAQTTILKKIKRGLARVVVGKKNIYVKFFEQYRNS